MNGVGAAACSALENHSPPSRTRPTNCSVSSHTASQRHTKLRPVPFSIYSIPNALCSTSVDRILTNKNMQKNKEDIRSLSDTFRLHSHPRTFGEGQLVAVQIYDGSQRREEQPVKMYFGTIEQSFKIVSKVQLTHEQDMSPLKTKESKYFINQHLITLPVNRATSALPQTLEGFIQFQAVNGKKELKTLRSGKLLHNPDQEHAIPPFGLFEAVPINTHGRMVYFDPESPSKLGVIKLMRNSLYLQMKDEAEGKEEEFRNGVGGYFYPCTKEEYNSETDFHQTDLYKQLRQLTLPKESGPSAATSDRESTLPNEFGSSAADSDRESTLPNENDSIASGSESFVFDVDDLDSDTEIHFDWSGAQDEEDEQTNEANPPMINHAVVFPDGPTDTSMCDDDRKNTTGDDHGNVQANTRKGKTSPSLTPPSQPPLTQPLPPPSPPLPPSLTPPSQPPPSPPLPPSLTPQNKSSAEKRSRPSVTPQPSRKSSAETSAKKKRRKTISFASALKTTPEETGPKTNELEEVNRNLNDLQHEHTSNNTELAAIERKIQSKDEELKETENKFLAIKKQKEVLQLAKDELQKIRNSLWTKSEELQSQIRDTENKKRELGLGTEDKEMTTEMRLFICKTWSSDQSESFINRLLNDVRDRWHFHGKFSDGKKPIDVQPNDDEYVVLKGGYIFERVRIQSKNEDVCECFLINQSKSERIVFNNLELWRSGDQKLPYTSTTRESLSDDKIQGLSQFYQELGRQLISKSTHLWEQAKVGGRSSSVEETMDIMLKSQIRIFQTQAMEECDGDPRKFVQNMRRFVDCYEHLLMLDISNRPPPSPFPCMDDPNLEKFLLSLPHMYDENKHVQSAKKDFLSTVEKNINK